MERKKSEEELRMHVEWMLGDGEAGISLMNNALFHFVRFQLLQEAYHKCLYCPKEQHWTIISPDNHRFRWADTKKGYIETVDKILAKRCDLLEGLANDSKNVTEMDENTYCSYLGELKKQYWNMQVQILLVHGKRLLREYMQSDMKMGFMEKEVGFLKWDNNSCSVDAVLSTIPFIVGELCNMEVLGKETTCLLMKLPVTAVLTLIHYSKETGSRKTHRLMSNYARETAVKLACLCMNGSSQHHKKNVLWEPKSSQGFLDIQDVVDTVLVPLFSPKVKHGAKQGTERMIKESEAVHCHQWIITNGELESFRKTELFLSVIDLISNKKKHMEIHGGLHVLKIPSRKVHSEVDEIITDSLLNSEWSLSRNGLNCKLVAGFGYRDMAETHFVGYLFEEKPKIKIGKLSVLEREEEMESFVYISDGMCDDGKFNSFKVKTCAGMGIRGVDIDTAHGFLKDKVGKNAYSGKVDEWSRSGSSSFKINASGLRLLVIIGNEKECPKLDS